MKKQEDNGERKLAHAVFEGFMKMPLLCKNCGKNVEGEFNCMMSTTAIPEAISELKEAQMLIGGLLRIFNLSPIVAVYCRECGERIHPTAIPIENCEEQK